jgi:hypothetical protein
MEINVCLKKNDWLEARRSAECLRQYAALCDKMDTEDDRLNLPISDDNPGTAAEVQQ